MRTGGVLNLFGKLLLILSLFLLTPIPFSAFFHDGLIPVYIYSAMSGALIGILLVAMFPPEKELGYRDGFALVVLSWLGATLIGALPYYFSRKIPSFVDCYFESMSGFTTTGSTVLSIVEILPQSLLFWRSLSHWLGGMGIIVLALAVFPLLGVGGMQFFQAEMPGPTKERLTPRIQNTARILWSVYVLLTAAETGLLLLGGVDFFDALCHAFATLATGGFSTHSQSVAYYDSLYVESVILVFMFLAGINFSLHFQLLRGKVHTYWKSEECIFYMLLIFCSTLCMTAIRYLYDHAISLGAIFRETIFQVVAIITTTGFGTADFNIWPPFCQVLLIGLMFIGGCAGSTSGGMKAVRILLFFKYARLQLRHLVHPNQVERIKLDKMKVPQEILLAILGFFALYVVFFLIASLAVTSMGVDIVTGTTAVITTLNNIGPGLHNVGPLENFGHLPATVKVVLIFCMLAGRLELYTVAVLLTPSFWKMARRPSLRPHRFSLGARQWPGSRTTRLQRNNLQGSDEIQKKLPRGVQA